MRRRLGVAGLAILTALGTGCTPTRHRLQPYRDDEGAARGLSLRAREACAARRSEAELPPHAFTSDGCSMWPNVAWVDCCIEHDIEYWCGGSARDRKRADESLRRCVAERGPIGMGAIMYIGARTGGIPWQPFPWRWGYGWECIRGYEATESWEKGQ